MQKGVGLVVFEILVDVEPLDLRLRGEDGTAGGAVKPSEAVFLWVGKGAYTAFSGNSEAGSPVVFRRVT